MKVKEARIHITELLREKGLLEKQESICHMVAIHERCGRDVEFIPSRQWYIDVLSEKERFLKAADEIRWHPEHMKNRYRIWVENLKWDWCISRQRYFGVPFPVWYCRDCQKPAFAEDSQLPVNPLENRPLHPCSCGCDSFVPEEAVFDTWATSSLTPLINAKFWEKENTFENIPKDTPLESSGNFSEALSGNISGESSGKSFGEVSGELSGEASPGLLPMGMRSQAHEIIRTWAFYTIVKSLYHTGQIPWRDIMISGYVLAKPGEKISKSKNNAGGSPMALIETHSADAIRYWAASSKLGTDTFFSAEELKISRRFLNKLYNAARFAILQLEDFAKPTQYDESGLLPVDRWILQRVNETTLKAARALEDYEIGQARHEIDNLFWRDFCDYYIEIAKERLYQPEKHGAAQRYSGQIAVYYGLLGILKLYAIYTPYMTEYIYQCFYRKYEETISLHQTLWTTGPVQEDCLAFGAHLENVIAQVRKDKSERQMSMKDSIPELVISCPEELKTFYEESLGDIAACTGAGGLCCRLRPIKSVRR